MPLNFRSDLEGVDAYYFNLFYKTLFYIYILNSTSFKKQVVKFFVDG